MKRIWDNGEKCEAFLVEFEALLRKHNLTLDSCYCCDSPSLAEPHGNVTIERCISHLREVGVERREAIA